MTKQFHITITKNEEGFIGDVIELPGCHTQGDSMTELINNLKEAISLYLECEEETTSFESFVSLQTIEV